MTSQLEGGNLYFDFSTNSLVIQPYSDKKDEGEGANEGRSPKLPPRPEAEGVTGLSTCHISPFALESSKIIIPTGVDEAEGIGSFYTDCIFIDRTRAKSEYHVPKYVGAKVVIADGGAVVKVVTERISVSEHNALGYEKSGRGNVVTFSNKSRQRLLRTLAKTEKAVRPLFLTLTYPDMFPSDPAEVKRNLDAVGKRFKRKFPDVAFVWRLEYKTRKTGVNAGLVAPHLHLLVWNADYKALRGWLPLAWYQIVKSGDKRHLLAGTNIEYLRSWRGVMYYASKYIAKVDKEILPDNVGRFWGVVGRDNLPLAGVVVYALTAGQAVIATRLGRKMLGIKGKSLRYGLTWLIDGKAMIKYIEWLLSSGGASPYNGLRLSGRSARALW